MRSDLNFGIFDVTDGRFLGGMGLHHPDWSLRSFMIGYWLRVSAEGNGFMTESVKLVSDFALEHLAARRVEISCVVRNDRSQAVAVRCGFILEGRLRNALPDGDGNPVDGFVYSRVPGDANASVTG